MIFLETERLCLRNLIPADLAALCDYRANEACRRYQRGRCTEPEALRALIASNARATLETPGPHTFAIAARADGRLVGDVFVRLEDPTISLGYTVSYRYHRRGYAFELLSALTARLHRLYPQRELVCCVEPENSASVALLHKLGFADEGYAAPLQSLIFSKWAVPAPGKEATALAQGGIR